MTISSPSNIQPQGASEKEEIWSTILSTVASSRMVPTKRVLVLGDSSSGKSTLIHYLKNDPGPQAVRTDNDHVPTFGVNNNYVPLPVENLDDDTTSTLALGYNVIDVQDEESEAIARLGVYQLGLSAAEYLPLLKFALGTDTLADSAVIIVLDWTRPWAFLESLQRWIHVLQHRINEICKDGTAGESWSKGKAIVDELREKMEHYLQTYAEPTTVHSLNMAPSTSTESVPSTPNTSTSTQFPNTPIAATPLVTTTTSADQVTLPLSQGTLTNNLGIPIIIVCCKSDAIDKLDQTMDYKDEHFDFVQQMMRCICMKYGAALFYTSTRQPYTFHNLRQYLLHRLLTTPNKPFPFNMKAQVIERDVVLVPSGWDSWGKLRVLREGFDCESVNDGWDSDIDAIADRQQPGAHGSRGIYDEVISDPSSNDQPMNTIPPPVTCEEEQAFLDRHYETLKHVSDMPNRKGTGATTKPGVVGPIGVPSETDLTRSGENNKPKDSSVDKPIKLSNSTSSSTTNTLLGMPSVSPASSVASNLPHIDTGAGQPNGPSHEVLANFFQSLLSKKASSGGSSPTSLLGARDSDPATNNTIPTSTRRPTISRKDVHKELDRMRQFVNKP